MKFYLHIQHVTFSNDIELQFGEKGGPIVQKVDNVTKLIGITSWLADDNINCDTGPAVFENVGYFSTWIKDGIRVLLKGNSSKNADVSENAMHLH